MLYNSMAPLKFYNNQSPAPLPKGEKLGYEDMIFVLGKSQIETINLLNTDGINHKSSYFKNYFIDAIYKDKIGLKKIVQNRTSEVKKVFTETPHPGTIRFISNASKVNYFKKKLNVINDLSIWMDLFFQFRRVTSTKYLCESFIDFLLSKVNDIFYDDYNKYILIDVNTWFNTKKLSYDRKDLNDPLTLILLSLYKFPELCGKLFQFEFIIIDSSNGGMLKLNGNDLVKSNYSRIKSRLSNFKKLKSLESESLETEIDKSTELNENDKKEIISKNRAEIINSVKKNFVGEIEDITTDVPDFDYEEDPLPEKPERDNLNEEIRDDEIITTDNPLDTDIEDEINHYLDENPELLDVDTTDAVAEVEDHIKKKIYIASFNPERPKDVVKRIDKLAKAQAEIIQLPSFEDLDSKVIATTNFSDYIKTSNPNIVDSKFVNFDKSYNDKKLNRDIDEAVSILSTADSKVFITSKEEEDTSDQLNLKKTMTYNLEDENGYKMKLVFDIPIIIDDKFIYLNGSKKIMQHQLIMKPLVKSKPDAVWIVAQYKKIYITRKGTMDVRATNLKKLLLSNMDTFNVKTGNSIIKNKEYSTSLEFDIIAKNIYSFETKNAVFITEIDKLKERLTKLNIPYGNVSSDSLLVGYDKVQKIPIIMNLNDKNLNDYIQIIIDFLDEDSKNMLKKIPITKRLMYAQATIMEKSIPIILLMMFFEGFKSVMEKSNIEYEIRDLSDLKGIDKTEYGITKLSDKAIVWKRYPLENSLMMNGLQNLPMELYTYEELESRDTYVYLLSIFYAFANMAFNLDQFKDFMIDNITKEILMDYHLPTDLVSLMAYAVKLLADNKYLPENNLNNMRVRSNELIAFHTYNAIADAYNKYRKTKYKGKPTKISIKKDAVMLELKKSKLIDDNSVLNPVLELEKNRAVSYKGERGINLEQAMTIDKRAYDESMLGVIGISTSPDANVGILRQLTLEPNITSTRGYIETTKVKDVDGLNSANLLTPAELLTPLGVQHDDPSRTSINCL